MALVLPGSLTLPQLFCDAFMSTNSDCRRVSCHKVPRALYFRIGNQAARAQECSTGWLPVQACTSRIRTTTNEMCPLYLSCVPFTVYVFYVYRFLDSDFVVLL